MVQIEFSDGGRVMKGILLGKYQRPHEEVCSYERKILWRTKTILKRRRENAPFYVVFVPWKHKEKELMEIEEKQIVNLQSVRADAEWIQKDEYVSKIYDGPICHASMKVVDFAGYPFLYENNSFVINLCLREREDNLKILYEHMPEVLNVDLDHAEE